MEDRRKEILDETVSTTNYLDKLFEMSMEKPDVWNIMKKQEYHNYQVDPNRSKPKIKIPPAAS